MFHLSLFVVCFSLIAVLQSLSPHLRGVSPTEKHFYQSQTEFTCRFTGSKIPLERVNDNYCDCSDGSDEPGTSACSNGQFFCRNKPFEPKFIPSSQVNDGVCDCCDGSDEYLSGSCSNTCKDLASRTIQQKQEELRNYKLGVEARNVYISTASQTFQEKQQTLAQLQNTVQELEKNVEVLKGLKEEAEKAEREELLREAEEAEAKKKEQEQAQQAQETVEQQNQQVESPQQDQQVETQGENVQPQEVEEPILDTLSEDHHDDDDDNDDDDDDDDEDEDDDDHKVKSDFPVQEEGKFSEVGKRANEARDQHRQAQNQLGAKQSELNELQRTLASDYGTQREFMPLHGRCFEYPTPEYTYEMCPFDSAKQAGTSLGRFDGWDAGYSIMKFTDGASCWGGPKRSLTVHFKCGAEDKILNVHEPSKCTYEMDFATPASCDLQHMMVLELNMQEYFSENDEE